MKVLETRLMQNAQNNWSNMIGVHQTKGVDIQGH